MLGEQAGVHAVQAQVVHAVLYRGRAAVRQECPGAEPCERDAQQARAAAQLEAALACSAAEQKA